MRANHCGAGFDRFEPKLTDAAAYVLMCALRRIGVAHTILAQATCGTIRLKLLKTGAQVRVSVRRTKIAMASACPDIKDFVLAQARICAEAQ